MKSFAAIGALLAVASAAPSSDLQRREDIYIRPNSTSTFNVKTGAIQYKVPTGSIHKGANTAADPDITTLVVFDVPLIARGKTCSFIFELNSCFRCNPTPPSGSSTFDLYTSLNTTAVTPSGAPAGGNLRDIYIGRLKAQKPGAATWVDGAPKLGQAFPCPAGTTVVGEFVGVDTVNMQWDGQGEGPYIKAV